MSDLVSTPTSILRDRLRLPGLLILLCLSPLLFHGLGFSGEAGPSPPAPLYTAMAGDFLHTLFEWSAFCLALFIGLLSLAHYRMTGNLLILLIGGSLLFSGCLDALHALVSVHLLGAATLNSRLIPLTWTLGRLCNGLFMGISVAYLLFRGRLHVPAYAETLRRRLGLLGLLLLLSAAALMLGLANVQSLPQSIFAEPPLLGLFTRPYDLLPLALYLLLGLGLYPRFYRAHPSVFSYTLMLSLIPDACTQLYMALGSAALFDGYFYLAHGLKLFSYMLPLAGLMLDYLQTHLQQEHLVKALQQQIQQRSRLEREVLEISHREQDRIGKDLHDSLGQLLTGAALLGEGLRRQSRDSAVEAKAAQLTGLLNDAVAQIRSLSRILSPIDLLDGDLPEALREIARRTEGVFGISCRMTLHGSWPEVPRNLAVHLYRIVQEATHNSVKHSGASLIEIVLSSEREAWQLEVSDNGQGIFVTEIREGLGLQLMQSRADSIGAELTITSSAEGVRVRCRLPHASTPG